jgi:hypothetical protein
MVLVEALIEPGLQSLAPWRALGRHSAEPNTVTIAVGTRTL